MDLLTKQIFVEFESQILSEYPVLMNFVLFNIILFFRLSINLKLTTSGCGTRTGPWYELYPSCPSDPRDQLSSEPRKASNYNRTNNLRTLGQHFVTYLAYQCALPRGGGDLNNFDFFLVKKKKQKHFWVFGSQVQATVLVCRKKWMCRRAEVWSWLSELLLFFYINII